MLVSFIYAETWLVKFSIWTFATSSASFQSLCLPGHNQVKVLLDIKLMEKNASPEKLSPRQSDSPMDKLKCPVIYPKMSTAEEMN